MLYIERELFLVADVLILYKLYKKKPAMFHSWFLVNTLKA